MLISIVIPVYNSSTTISPLVQKLVVSLGQEDLQIVLINDGSQDNSHELCRDLVSEYPSIITYLNLSKNFGEHNAVMAGLNYSKGEYVVIMDDDFQNPPEEVQYLIDMAKEGDYDIVYTYYEKKKHQLFRNIGSSVHNWMASYLLHKPKDLYLSSFKCISRFAVDQVTKYDGPYPYLDGLLLRCTRRIGKINVRHDERQEGVSTYSLTKLIRLWLNMFLNFSILPLRLSSLCGMILSAAGVVMALLVVAEKLANPHIAIGWPSTVVIITIFSGVQLFIMGVLGEYLGTMFLSQNRTPQFVVREIYEGKNSLDRS